MVLDETEVELDIIITSAHFDFLPNAEKLADSIDFPKFLRRVVDRHFSKCHYSHHQEKRKMCVVYSIRGSRLDLTLDEMNKGE